MAKLYKSVTFSFKYIPCCFPYFVSDVIGANLDCLNNTAPVPLPAFEQSIPPAGTVAGKVLESPVKAI